MSIGMSGKESMIEMVVENAVKNSRELSSDKEGELPPRSFAHSLRCGCRVGEDGFCCTTTIHTRPTYGGVGLSMADGSSFCGMVALLSAKGTPLRGLPAIAVRECVEVWN